MQKVLAAQTSPITNASVHSREKVFFKVSYMDDQEFLKHLKDEEV